MKFLIVDDDERIALLISKILSKYGECTVAPNGDEAIKRFKEQHQASEPFDAVFMDIMMPGMDGHEVVRQMRSLEKELGVKEINTFKLVMISALSDTKNVCKSFFHGYADAYVAKPDIKEKLLEELRNIKLID
ncbi:MAG: response regulator [Desulfovibrionaceae bacterium]